MAELNSLGLTTTALPAASAYAMPHSGVYIGKFHGAMTPATPSGRYSTFASKLTMPMPGLTVRALSTRSAFAAAHLMSPSAAINSNCTSPLGLPVSRLPRSQISSECLASQDAQRFIRRCRSSNPRPAHHVEAARALATTACTSAGVCTGYVPICAPVAGWVRSNVWPVAARRRRN